MGKVSDSVMQLIDKSSEDIKSTSKAIDVGIQKLSEAQKMLA